MSDTREKRCALENWIYKLGDKDDDDDDDKDNDDDVDDDDDAGD